MIKKINVRRLAVLAAFAAMFALPMSSSAQDAAATFKGKCAGCHGADGSKKMGDNALNSPEVQKMSDADLASIITGGKGKMPAYKSLTPDQVNGLVAYIRTLKK
jgi:cytochrome c6